MWFLWVWSDAYEKAFGAAHGRAVSAWAKIRLSAMVGLLFGAFAGVVLAVQVPDISFSGQIAYFFGTAAAAAFLGGLAGALLAVVDFATGNSKRRARADRGQRHNLFVLLLAIVLGGGVAVGLSLLIVFVMD